MKIKINGFKYEIKFTERRMVCIFHEKIMMGKVDSELLLFEILKELKKLNKK